jgi:hypothetical protein
MYKIQMQTINFNGIFIWNNASMGDVLLSIALIDRAMKKYPDLSFILGCWKRFSYLADHLPISVLGFTPLKGIDNYFFNAYCPINYYSFNSQFGMMPHAGKKFQWKFAIENFNNATSGSIVHLEYEELEIELKDLDIDIPENAIFVENGPSYSGHNDFYVNIDLISSKFPQFKFYCTSKTNTYNSNVIDMSDENAIYLQSVQRKCKAILGKGSGPFILSFNKDCRKTPKALFGFKVEEFGKLWDNDAAIEYFSGTDESVERFLDKIK